MNTDFFAEYCILAADGTEISESASDALESAESTNDASDVSPAQTVVLGVGTVFVGLIAIIIICKIVGFFCNLGSPKSDDEPVAAVKQPEAPKAAQITVNRGELAAAVAAAIAEEIGTDVSGIKIISIKRI